MNLRKAKMFYAPPISKGKPKDDNKNVGDISNEPRDKKTRQERIL